MYGDSIYIRLIDQVFIDSYKMFEAIDCIHANIRLPSGAVLEPLRTADR